MSDDLVREILEESRRKQARAIALFVGILLASAIVAGLLLYVNEDHEERDCRARGGAYECKTTNGFGVGLDGKSGVVTVTSCECSKRDLSR